MARFWAASLLGAACHGYSTTPVPRLPMEAHGFNDLEVWPQTLAAGVRWLKLDAAICTREACTQFSTWGARGNASECFSSGGEEFCCICLRGDTSSRPYLLDPFNTTDDLVALLNDTTSTGFLPTSTEDTLTIGLDFGTGPVFPGPDGCFFGCPAAPLVRRWLLAMFSVIRARGLAVRGAADGSVGGWFADLDERCAAGTCSAEDTELQAAGVVGQSGASWGSHAPATLPRALAGDVNDDYDSFTADCARGAWADVPPTVTPWLWYEQTGQADFVKMMDWWVACESLPAEKRADLSTQLVMVSNMGPAQMEVFQSAANASLRGLNQPVQGLPRAAPLTQPWVLALQSDPSTAGALCGGCDTLVVLTAVSKTTTPAVLTAWLLPMTGRTAPPVSSAIASLTVQLPCAGAGDGLVSLTPARWVGQDDSLGTRPSPVLLTAVCSSGEAASFVVDPTTGAFPPFPGCPAGVCTWSLPVRGPGSVVLAAAVVCAEPLSTPLPSTPATLPCTLAAGVLTGSSVSVQVSSPVGAGGGVLAFTPVAEGVSVDRGAALALMHDASSGGPAFQGVLLYASTRPVNSTGPSLSALARMSEEELEGVLAQGVSDTALHSRGGGVRGAARVHARAAVLSPVLTSQRDGATLQAGDEGSAAYLYGAVVSVSVAGWERRAAVTATVSVAPSPPAGGGPPPRLAFGSSPSLSTARFNGSSLLLALTTDAPCDCGLWVNNADLWRCGLQQPAYDWDPFYTTFQSVPFTVAADWGLLSDWVATVSAPGAGGGGAPYNGWLGMCNSAIVHSKLETGASAGATLYPWSVSMVNASGLAASPHAEVAVLAVHDATVPFSPPQNLLCGLPDAKQGLVWDAWHLVQPDVLAGLPR